MFYIIFSVHIALCVSLILLVLIQQGKGADAGAIMGGGTDSLLAAGSAGSAISKMTTSLAIGFMITSIFLVRNYDNRPVAGPGVQQFDALDGSVLGSDPAAPPASSLLEVPAAGDTEESSEKVEEGQEKAAGAAAGIVVETEADAAVAEEVVSEENQATKENQGEVPAEGSTESKESGK